MKKKPQAPTPKRTIQRLISITIKRYREQISWIENEIKHLEDLLIEYECDNSEDKE